jgi:hypothetical protein
VGGGGSVRAGVRCGGGNLMGHLSVASAQCLGEWERWAQNRAREKERKGSSFKSPHDSLHDSSRFFTFSGFSPSVHGLTSASARQRCDLQQLLDLLTKANVLSTETALFYRALLKLVPGFTATAEF